jgi:glycosyltransferase involved in cell wall biosynthesis
LQVVGSGWWEARLHEYAQEHGAGDTVVFRGHLDEAAKNEVYERAWVLALPSLKEGWGLVVGEAGMHGTPTVAYREAGGTRESVADGFSGVLVDDRDGFGAALGELLADEERREQLGRGARVTSHAFTWEHAQESFATVIRAVLRGQRVDAQDPDPENDAG